MARLKFGWGEVSLVPEGKKINLAGQFYERITDEVRDPISVITRLMPAPITMAEMLPKMYANTFAGRFTFASSSRSASSSEGVFSIYCVRIFCAINC